MDSTEAKGKGKSLRARGKEILRAPFSGFKTRQSSGTPGDSSTPGDYNKLSSTELAGLEGLRRSSVNVYNDPTPEFLTRSPDPEWIDIEMMGHWLQKCDNEHGERCRRPFGMASSSFGRPNLLIDVKRRCLVKAQASNRYACLSYVWGGASTLKTEKETLLSLMEENSLELHREKIPRTIRDTINFVNQLGIPYLWVDCLCIIQDDIESKHGQIQAMAGIYANAYVTIVAGNGWDANHGLRGIQGVTAARQLSQFLKSDFEETLQPYSSIWYSRGWTFQEMIFSPRKLMFQYQLAVWECNTSSWHEGSLSTTRDSLKNSGYVPHVTPWQNQIRFSVLPDIAQYISSVHDYTRRKLTFPDDAFPAITSLLSVMSSSFDGGFIGGLPQMFFDEALLWQPKEPTQRRSATPGQDLPPSWSWAGWEGEILQGGWESHFCHLNFHSPWMAVLLARGEPVLQVRPIVKWSYGQSLDERIKIEPTGRRHIGNYVDNLLPLPPKWSLQPTLWLKNPDNRWPSRKNTGDLFLYSHDPTTATMKYAFPIPVPDRESPPLVFPRYLFCHTTRGYFKSTSLTHIPSAALKLWQLSIILEDRIGNLVGSLNLNLGLVDYREPPDSTEYELVAISAGAIQSKGNVGGLKGSRAISPALGWANFPRIPIEDDLSSWTNVEFYYVMWIGWEGGIAHRKGLGRVLKEAWDREAVEEIDLVLG